MQRSAIRNSLTGNMRVVCCVLVLNSEKNAARTRNAHTRMAKTKNKTRHVS